MAAGANDDNPTYAPHRRWAPYIAPAVFALLTLAMFGDVLVTNQRVLSHRSTDLALQFLPWRQFGFDQMRQGNLPLWNPHIYGGTPYFAGFQSALLYPPNWLHLVLPLNVAINWIIALHVFAAGFFTYLWVRRRGISLGGSTLAGAMFMFGGPYFLHVYAGHLPHVAVMVWTPLVLLAIDELARTGAMKWALLGSVALSMQILAGHPQYVYYTGIALAFYAILQLIQSQHRIALGGGFVAMYVGAALLSAVQLLPGIMAATESVRGAGTTYQFASTFSLPPRNFITLIAPNFFGRLPVGEGPQPADSYWGAGYLWEMSLFVSLTGLVLAIHGAVARRTFQSWIALAMIALTLLLALGRHTPLYGVMFDYFPQYSSFRGTVKFAYLTSLFTALLAGCGFDALTRSTRLSRGLVASVAGACVLMLIGAILVDRAGPDGAWARSLQNFAKAYGQDREIFVKPRPQDYAEPAFVLASARNASRSLYLAATVGALVVTLLIARQLRPVAAYGLVLLGVIELFIYAHSTRATMTPHVGFPKDGPAEVVSVYRAWEDALGELPRDQRALIVLPQFSNLGMSMGFDALWGYDPLVLRRYAELLFASQNYDWEFASQYLSFRQVAPGIFRALRCGRVLIPDPRQPVVGVPDGLPVVSLVGRWVELPDRDAIFRYMLRDEFDPRRGVVVEANPGIANGDARVEDATVELVGWGTDHLDVRAITPRDALLLITNNYARGWRVRSLGSSGSQRNYQIIPGNWAQQAIALRAGSHHLRIEYSPVEFRVGAWVSALSLIALGAGSLFTWHGLPARGPRLRGLGESSSRPSRRGAT